jgi:hypothetical protein
MDWLVGSNCRRYPERRGSRRPDDTAPEARTSGGFGERKVPAKAIRKRVVSDGVFLARTRPGRRAGDKYLRLEYRSRALRRRIHEDSAIFPGRGERHPAIAPAGAAQTTRLLKIEDRASKFRCPGLERSEGPAGRRTAARFRGTASLCPGHPSTMPRAPEHYAPGTRALCPGHPSTMPGAPEHYTPGTRALCPGHPSTMLRAPEHYAPGTRPLLDHRGARVLRWGFGAFAVPSRVPLSRATS